MDKFDYVRYGQIKMLAAAAVTMLVVMLSLQLYAAYHEWKGGNKANAVVKFVTSGVSAVICIALILVLYASP